MQTYVAVYARPIVETSFAAGVVLLVGTVLRTQNPTKEAAANVPRLIPVPLVEGCVNVGPEGAMSG